MHKLKAAARHHAWYSDEEEGRNLNPFGKFRSNEYRPGDAEDGLGRTQSEMVSPIDQERRKSQFANVTSPPPHPVTMPVGSSKHESGSAPQSQPTSPTKIGSGGGDDANNDSGGITAGSGRKEGSSEESGTSTGSTLVTKNTNNINNNTIDSNDPKSSSSTNSTARNRKPGLAERLHLKKKEEQPIGQGADVPKKPERSRRKKKTYSIASQIRCTIFNSYINILLVMVPVGIAINFTPVNKIAVFVVNFIAIIPLAAMLSYATEEIALHVGETIGGLLNATFGNAVELIVSIIALFHDEIVIVQTSLIGSMLSNLLLVMGMCFFFGGLNRIEQHFNVVVAQTATSLLALAVASLIIPTAFSRWADLPGTADDASLATSITELSRGTSILLLLVYGAYLFFQLRTHIEIYNEPSKKATKRKQSHKKGDASKGLVQMAGAMATQGTNDDIRPSVAQGEKAGHDEDDDKEEPQLTVPVALFTLVWSTALVGVCAEFLVDSIDYVTTTSDVSKTFVGLILLPIVGNAAEHATAVTVACKDKMDLAIGVAVGSSMQIALLVLPLVVTIGWMAGKSDMDLNFDGFEVIVLFVAILLVNYLIGDGKSHWLEGVLLQVLYLIIAIAAWFFPNAASKVGSEGSGG